MTQILEPQIAQMTAIPGPPTHLRGSSSHDTHGLRALEAKSANWYVVEYSLRRVLDANLYADWRLPRNLGLGRGPAACRRRRDVGRLSLTRVACRYTRTCHGSGCCRVGV